MLLLQTQMNNQITSTQFFMKKAETFATAFQQNSVKERTALQTKGEDQ
jgi:hypothetical protein